MRRGVEPVGARLALLRRRMFATPSRCSGVERCFGYTVRVLDGPDFYIQYKDQFVHRIYHFHAERPDPLIIDGGSNVGLSVLYFKRAYPKARVIAFEPDPEVFQVLSDNMRRNQLEGVTLVNAGLAATADMAAFVQDGSASGHLADDGDVKVKTERLSDYLTEPVDFLKLNIEGSELPVLEEAEAAGRLRNVRELVLEYHGWPGGEQRLGAILELLDRQGFRYLVHDFDRETGGASKPPFHLEPNTTWFCLVYAKRVDQRVSAQRTGAGSRSRALALGMGVQPRSEVYGYDRGTPICRYYMARFLEEFASDIRGHCLEFQDPGYVTTFGGTRVTKLDILHVDASNPRATIVVDLTKPNHIPSDTFDCVVCTFVLHIIGEPDRAVVELQRILRPGGVLLVGVPHVAMYDPEFSDLWRFTPEGLQHLLAQAFGPAGVTTRAYGNSLTAAGQIRGLAAEEFTVSELGYHDPKFAVQVCARVVKSGAIAPAPARDEAQASEVRR